VGEDNQPLEAHFDRCTPSVLAFRDQPAATAFAGGHGGRVVKFSDFAAELQR
jgi:nitrous oxide reductase accessory protein NosL